MGKPSSKTISVWTDLDRGLGILQYRYRYHCNLKETAPYLFSLAVRTNPFNPEASLEVE